MHRSLFKTLSVVALTAVAAACGPPAPGGGNEPARVGLDPPLVLPDASLEAPSGARFHLRDDTPGDVTLVFFGYTYCPDICPVHMANLAAVLRDLPLEVTRRIDVLFITTDPERDTRERLREWLGSLHPRFVGLRGTRTEITALEESLGIPVSVVSPDEETADGGYFVGHAAQVIAFSRDDTARVAYPWGTRQRDWLSDLPALVRGEIPGAEGGQP
jgi:protein SCO1/2